MHVNAHSSASLNALTNLYAAVPSMHVAFALMIGWTLARLVRWRVVRVLWMLYPFLMAFVIVVTANHFIIDAFLGALTARRVRVRRELAGACATAGVALLDRLDPAVERERLERSSGMAPPGSTPRHAGARRSSYRAGRDARRARRSVAGQRRELVRNRLIESRLTPNAISLTGFVLNVVAAVLVWEQLFFLGGIAFIVGSIMDTLDGRYSRMSGKGTPFGAFLDSTLDRIEEGIVLTAVAGYFALQGNRAATAAVVVAVLASLMVSYTRARAEALGVECKVGIATRPVRVVILAIGLVFAQRRLARQLRAAAAGRVRARGAERDHGRAAHLARARASCRCDLRRAAE